MKWKEIFFFFIAVAIAFTAFVIVFAAFWIQEEILSKSITFQLQRLFLALQTSKKRAVETTDITKSFGWDSSEAWQQHDIQV